MKSQSVMKRLTILVVIFFLATFTCWMLDQENFHLMLNALWRIVDEDSYFKQYTVPLSSTVARDLCVEFKIPDSDWRCEEEKVYAIDFYPAITDYYLGAPDQVKILNAVQSKIGDYEILVERKVKNGTHIYWHWYDFTGDQRYPLVIVFDEKGFIIDIRSHIGRSS